MVFIQNYILPHDTALAHVLNVDPDIVLGALRSELVFLLSTPTSLSLLHENRHVGWNPGPTNS